jgi:chitinase
MARRLPALALPLILGLACTSTDDGVADGDDVVEDDFQGEEEGDWTTVDAGDSTSEDAATGDAATGDAATGDSSDTTTGDGDCELADIIDQATWDAMFLHEDDPACFGSTYTLQGLLDAAADYPTFACEGDDATRRRELAAFLAQISHETTGGWPDAPDGPYAWGLCFIEEVGCQNNACPQYCDAGNPMYPCAPGKTYHGRGAIQLSWNYNYGQAGDALGVDLLGDPDLVANDSKLAIQTAMWFWMTEQLPKPSAHDVMAGNWQPSAQDLQLGRLPGFGLTTNIINGGLECAQPGHPGVADRIGFFERATGMLGTDMGENVDCDMMTPY